MITYLSVTSGIAADTVAWGPLGWQCLAYAEIEPFPCAVLDYHYGCGAPEVMPSPLCAKTPKEAKRLEAMATANAKLPPRVAGCPPNLGDIRSVTGARVRDLLEASGLGHLNILMGGTPCQDFSVAGLRAGLTGDRGNLSLEFVRIADECVPDAVVWENVPGVLSDEGNAFGHFLSALVGGTFPAEPGPRPRLGKSGKFWRWSRKRGRHVPKWPAAGWVDGPKRTVAWRVLDAQYFGLAQRRRRLFIVGCPLGGADPRAILFEREGLRRDTPPSRQTEAGIAGTLEAGFGRSRGAGTPPGAITQSLTGRLGGGGPDDNKAQGGFYVTAFHGSQDPDVSGDVTHPVGRNQGREVCVMQGRWRGDDGRGYDRPPHVADLPSLDAHKVDMVAFGGECTESREVATALKGENQRQDFASETFVAYPLRAQSQSAPAPEIESLEDYVAHALRADGFDASEDGTGRGTPLVAAIAIRGREGGCNVEMRTDGLANTILTPSDGRSGIGVGAVLRESSVRRLLPLECELLMGLPPGYTLIPFGRAAKAEKMDPELAAFHMEHGCLTFEDACSAAADGPRYKSHGNSIAIPPLRWLGRRIEKVLLPVFYPEIFGVKEAV